jgi:hypothetical protein
LFHPDALIGIQISKITSVGACGTYDRPAVVLEIFRIVCTCTAFAGVCGSTAPGESKIFHIAVCTSFDVNPSDCQYGIRFMI